jgi:uncharacterized protein
VLCYLFYLGSRRIRRCVIDTSAIARSTQHRPWPLPRAPWVQQQGWYDLLFAHWPVSAATLRALVPPILELDTYDSDGWVSLTPFRVAARPRGLVQWGNLLSFPELNCRTYVRYKSIPGIYFFSLDAGSVMAVAGARLFYRLPYFHSRMRMKSEAGALLFESSRRASAAQFSARYWPTAPAHFAVPGTLEYWLAERYCLYVARERQVWRGEIQHGPWPLQNAEAEIVENTIGQAAEIPLAGPPALLGFSRRQEVLVWPLLKA